MESDPPDNLWLLPHRHILSSSTLSTIPVVLGCTPSLVAIVWLEQHQPSSTRGATAFVNIPLTQSNPQSTSFQDKDKVKTQTGLSCLGRLVFAIQGLCLCLHLSRRCPSLLRAISLSLSLHGLLPVFVLTFVVALSLCLGCRCRCLCRCLCIAFVSLS